MKRETLIRTAYAARSGSKLVTFLNAIVVIVGMTFILYHALFVW